MHPRGRTPESHWKSSCTIAHQPTENGEAEPQSIERKRSQSFWMSNGGTICLVPFQQSTNAPIVTDQSPSNHARTSSLLPDDRSRCLYASTYVLVIVDPRRDEHPFEPSQRVPDDAVDQGGGINVTLAHPLMPRPARVSRGTQTDWHARAGPQRRHQLHHWGGAREIPDLLYINSRVVVALVHVGIGIALQIGEA